MSTPEEHSSRPPDQVARPKWFVLFLSVFLAAAMGSWSISAVLSSNEGDRKPTEGPRDTRLQDLHRQLDRLDVLLERRLQQHNPDGRGRQP